MIRHLIPRILIQRQWGEALTISAGWRDSQDGWALVFQWLGLHLVIEIGRVDAVRP